MEIPCSPGLHRFAILTAGVTVGLIVAGATVTSTGSGDAVPDWPLSYGTLTPPMIGGIFYEHSHRLIAGLTGALIAILACWIWRKEPRQTLRWLGVAAVVAVLVQAALGGLRVLVVSTSAVQDTVIQLTGISRLETSRLAIAIIHAVLAQTILSILFLIVLLTSKSWCQPQRRLLPVTPDRKALPLSLGLIGLVFFQLLLAALMRHTGAGLIIPDFPLAFNKVIPAFDNLPHNPNAPFPLSETEFQFKVLLNFFHRVLAAVILAYIICFCYLYRKSKVPGLWLKTLLVLVTLQIFLGALNVWTAKSVFSTVPHVMVGALILGFGVVVGAWSWRLKAGWFFVEVQGEAGQKRAELVSPGILPRDHR